MPMKAKGSTYLEHNVSISSEQHFDQLNELN